MRDVHRFRGQLRIELRDADGRTVTSRDCRNTVVRSGAELVGALFAGTALTPVNGMSVGTNAQPLSAPYELSALRTADSTGAALAGTTVPVLPADIKVEPLPA